MPSTTTIRSTALTPAVVAFLASKRVRDHHATAFRVLQRLDPVHRSPLGITILSRHADVDAVLHDPTMSSDEDRADPALLRIGGLSRLLGKPETTEPGAFAALFGQVMLFRDPPDHTRLRSLVSRAFTPRRVEALESRVRAIAGELLDELLSASAPEFMRSFAYPFPARVVCELLGVPSDGVPLFVRHAPALAIGLDPGPMRTAEGLRHAETAAIELGGYLAELIERYRRQPADNLLSDLVHVEIDGGALDETELVAMALLLVVAGHETTANVLGTTTLRLLRTPPLRTHFATDDPARQRALVEEALRLDGPVQMAERITTSPITIGEEHLAAGTIVIVVVGAANRDPAVFDRPNYFVHDRPENPHLAFGAGPHYCVGAALARLELRVGLTELARRLPARAAPARRPVRRPSFTIGGLQHLHLRWT